MKKYFDNRKKLILSLIYSVLIVFCGVTYSYYVWVNSEDQRSDIAFMIDNLEFGYSCSGDGGGDILSNEAIIMPASCSSSKNVIMREITTNVDIKSNNLIVSLDLWLDVNELGQGLSESTNFKYSLTTTPNSCSTDVVSSGNFNGKTIGDKVNILSSEILYSSVNKYYLYIWLDEAETNVNTANQTFNLSLGGSCDRVLKEEVSPIESYSCVNGSVGSEPYVMTYTGDCEVIDDGDGDWRVKFLTGGDLTVTSNVLIDAFLVGGGGGGGVRGGGGGGYTKTVNNIILSTNTDYEIIIGEGGTASQTGGSSSAFTYLVKGGNGNNGTEGGYGGSGGGGQSGRGGSNGSNGGNGSYRDSTFWGGHGQGSTTCEFDQGTYGVGCDDGITMYAGGGSGQGNAEVSGGGGVGGNATGGNATINTGGGGGGGWSTGGTGGSGIVVIRNARKYNPILIDFEYTGHYEYIYDEDDNWRIKFLTSGTFTPLENLEIDAFLVGGGGGGGSANGYDGGGGGGYTKTLNNIILSANTDYEIIIGEGGAATVNGGNSSAFTYLANGGNGTSGSGGGSGGSGGGGRSGGVGGFNGSDGGNGSYHDSTFWGGHGQWSTTCEFDQGTYGVGCDDGITMYAGGGSGQGGSEVSGGGGAGGDGIGRARNGKENTGGGGGGGYSAGGSGGSGIVIIRNARKYNPVLIDFEYTGHYEYIYDDDNNWRIKFLTSGTFTPLENLEIDAFLVGGGGGGGSANGYDGGGGGGYTKTLNNIILSANTDYDIIVGEGGAATVNGGSSSAFTYLVNGGNGTSSSGGGSGGSGGGGRSGGVGGFNGSDGGNGVYHDSVFYGGGGQRSTTCEFNQGTYGVGCDDGITMYAGGGSGQGGSEVLGGGGAGGDGIGRARNGKENTGGGGGGGYSSGGSGGSGVVIIRKKN